ncbi:MAG: hypothetical protein J7K75_05710 [Desulfuromonas sp.]|nr:hypothetical protein [Desulfuromonas sp.]
MKKTTKMFLALSILIALSDLMLVAISGYNAKHALNDHFQHKGEQIANSVNMSLAASGLHMQQIAKLEKALEDVNTLSGMLPACAWCNRIHDDDGSWRELEDYLSRHSDTTFTHGICDDCITKHYPEFMKKFDKTPDNS